MLVLVACGTESAWARYIVVRYSGTCGDLYRRVVARIYYHGLRYNSLLCNLNNNNNKIIIIMT